MTKPLPKILTDMPTIKNIADLNASIAVSNTIAGSLQERIHHEAIACVLEFFRPASKGNTNWILVHLRGYTGKAGSFRVQSLAGWYTALAGVTIKQDDKTGEILSVKKDKKFPHDRDVEQLNKCKAMPYYKWGLLNLEKPLITPDFPESAATTLAKRVESGLATDEEALAWIAELSAKYEAKRKDTKVVEFATAYKKQHKADKVEEDADKVFMDALEGDNVEEIIPPVEELPGALQAQAS